MAIVGDQDRVETRATGTSEPSGDAVLDVSDDVADRIMRAILLALAGAVAVGVFAGAAVWASSGDDEESIAMNEVDVGFLRDMLDHHEQALLISNIYLDERPDSGVAPYAREVILYQQREIEWMEEWLAEEGYSRGEPDRTAMAWMDEPTPVPQMRGMQSQETLDRLDAATGEEADLMFFRVMTDHHLGGIHMGEHAAINGADPEITNFADAVATNQAIEINEYVGAARRLGLIPGDDE